MGFIIVQNWEVLKRLKFSATFSPNILLHFIGCLHTCSTGGWSGGEYTEKVNQQTDQKGNRVFL